MSVFRLLLFSFFLSACLSAQELINVKVQLNWKHQFEHAGFYAAIKQGYYEEVGLEITLLEKQKDLSSFDTIINKDAQFAVGYSSLVLEYIQGKPVVALASIFQHSPLVFLTKKSSNIRTVSDLAGKRVMINPLSPSSASLNAMVRKAGMTYDYMILSKHSHNIDDLINDKVDVQASYISNQPYDLIEKGIDYNIIDPVNYGYDFYENVLFTHKEMIDKNPMLVHKFVKATLKGWEYALKNSDEIIETILINYNTQNKSKAALEYEAKVIKESLIPKNTPIGEINKARFQRILFLYEELGLINQTTKTLDSFIYERKNGLKLSLTQREWIEKHPQVYFTGDPNWLPYEAFKNGEYQGIVNEHLKLIEEYTGLEFIRVPSRTWSQSIKMARQKKVDVLSETTSSLLKEELTFTKSYLSSPVVMVMKDAESYKDNITEISDKRVAVIKDYGYVTEIKQYYPDLNYVEVESLQAGLLSVESKKVDVLLCALPQASFWIKKLGLQNLRIVGKTKFQAALAFGVRSDYETLVTIMNKAIEFIPQKKQQEILNRWTHVQYSTKVDYQMLGIVVVTAFLIIGFLIVRHVTLSKYNKKLQYLSQTDNLTKIYNRAKLNEVLKERLQFYKRYNEGFGIILMDVDNFKKVNDHFGHDIGDRVLIEVSSLLEHNIRDVDSLGRWGGEEFLIVSPRMNKAGMEKLAEKLRSKLAKKDFDKVGIQTGSFGITVIEPNDTISSLIKKADIALYEAKNSGRNSVKFR